MDDGQVLDEQIGGGRVGEWVDGQIMDRWVGVPVYMHGAQR